jgi:hypothetical protein
LLGAYGAALVRLDDAVVEGVLEGGTPAAGARGARLRGEGP